MRMILRQRSDSVSVWVMIGLGYLPQGQAETRPVCVPCICHPCFIAFPTKLYGRYRNTYLLDLPRLRESRHSINTYLLTF